MKTTAKQRLISYIEFISSSQKRFEQAAGLSNGYINNLKSSPSADKLQKIIGAFPNLNPDWLLTGNGSMLRENVPNVSQTNRYGDNINGVNVSIGERLNRNATDAQREDENGVPMIPVEVYKAPNVDVIEYIGKAPSVTKKPKVPLFSEYDTLYQVYDRSMSPRFEPGDMLALKSIGKQNMIIKGEPYVINTYSSGLVFRVIYDYSDNHITCKSLNETEFLPFDIPLTDIINIFRAVGLVRVNV